MLTLEQFSHLLPLAAEWAGNQEDWIRKNGVGLGKNQIKDAKKISVSYPEKIRLLRVDCIPLPEEPSLKSAAQSTGLITSDTVGLTLRYGIFIRDDYWENREIIVHELVHVAQYERLGGIFPFLQKYLKECVEIGYPEAPMEQEAINKAKELIRL